MTVGSPAPFTRGTSCTRDFTLRRRKTLVRRTFTVRTDAKSSAAISRLRTDSLLPGWTRGHVLTHLARNADAHARRIAGALQGQDLGKYPGGALQRREEIEQGAARPAADILADLTHSQDKLADLMRQSDQAGWPNAHFLGGSHYGVAIGASRMPRLLQPNRAASSPISVDTFAKV